MTQPAPLQIELTASQRVLILVHGVLAVFVGSIVMVMLSVVLRPIRDPFLSPGPLELLIVALPAAALAFVVGGIALWARRGDRTALAVGDVLVLAGVFLFAGPNLIDPARSPLGAAMALVAVLAAGLLVLVPPPLLPAVRNS